MQVFGAVRYESWVWCLLLSIMLTGCGSVPMEKRYSLSYKQVEGNVIGPFLFESMRSPTEIDVIEECGTTSRRVTLEMRGVQSTPDVAFNKLVKEDSYYDLRDSNFGLYVLKDTAVHVSTNRIKGVVLDGIQGSKSHDLETGDVKEFVLKYSVVQSLYLWRGKLLIDSDDLDFGWRQDFMHFEKKARKAFDGYWSGDKNRLSLVPGTVWE